MHITHQEIVWERRDAPRFPVSWTAQVRSDGQRFIAHCTDVSSTGIGLQIDTNLAIGSIVDATIEITPGQTIEITAEVVRTSSHTETTTLGLRFIQLGQTSLIALYGYLAQRSARL